MSHYFFWGLIPSAIVFGLYHIVHVRYIHLEYEDRAKSALVTINNRIAESYRQGAKDMAKKMQEELARIQKVAEEAKLYVVATSQPLYPEHGESTKLSVAGAEWPGSNNPLNLYLNHDWTNPPIGLARPVVEDGCIKAAFHFFKDEDRDLYKMFYPSLAISFDREKDIVEEGGVKVYTKFKVFAVSLSATPNVDPYVKRLSEQ